MRSKQRRSDHGCITSNLGGKPIVWVTGGFGESDQGGDALQSTEYLEDLDQGWKSGTFPSILLTS